MTGRFSVGEPQIAGPLAVFPVFGPEPRARYRAFAQAIELGAFVRELESGAAVGSLCIENPTDLALLVYEGEEVLGAQQNRIFDASVLVAAQTNVAAPVSCVEQGRWDGRRFGERFRPSPQAADPSLRRTKRRSVNAHAAAGHEARADQGELWREVGTRLSRHRVASPSAAMSDVFDGRRADLEEASRAIRHLDDQLGAVAQVGGRVVALDLGGRADVFASLLPRLAQGYALEALGARSGRPDAEGAAARRPSSSRRFAPRGSSSRRRARARPSASARPRSWVVASRTRTARSSSSLPSRPMTTADPSRLPCRSPRRAAGARVRAASVAEPFPNC